LTENRSATGAKPPGIENLLDARRPNNAALRITPREFQEPATKSRWRNTA